MALQAILQSVDDLPEDLKTHYVEKDGKFFLDVTAVDGHSLENVAALKQALSKERAAAKRFHEELKAFEGLDAQDVRSSLEELEHLRESRKGPTTDEIRRTAFEQATKEWQKKVEAKDQELRSVTSQLEEVLIDATAVKALAENKGNPKLLLPHVKGSVRLRKTDDGKYVSEVVDRDGNTRLSSRGGSTEAMTIDELIKEMSTSDDFAAAFAGSGATGSGSTGSDRSTSSSRVTRLDMLEKMDPARRIDEIRKRAKTG